MEFPDVLGLFRISGALLEGHFRLSSGLHSNRYLQSALVLQFPELAGELGAAIEVIDLRSLSPWDKETVFASVKKTSRVIVAYEDSISWGYGAEIAASIADVCFPWLDAPVKRVASTDTFVGYAPQLEDAILPQVETFRRAYEEIVKF